MSHDKIASIPEPWLLLPFLYSRKENGIKSEYGHESAYKAISDLIKSLPEGEKDFYKALRNSILEIYSKFCLPKQKFFLDKTPRYYLIIPLINKLFPKAKFIFLFRNPISIFASYISAFNNNSLKRFDHFKRDLYKGPRLLSEGYNKIGEKSCFLKYEDLVSYPKKTIKNILDYLEIESTNNIIDFILESFSSQKIKGFGDHSIAKEYNKIKDNRETWKLVLNNRCRINVAKKYIYRIDDNYLNIGNYSKAAIIAEIDSLSKSTKKIGFKDYLEYLESIYIEKMKNIIYWKSYG
jgi:hypothetical protein